MIRVGALRRIVASVVLAACAALPAAGVEPDELVYRVVLASFPSKDAAQSFSEEVRTRLEQSPQIARAALDSGLWFRVAVGAFDTRAEAEAALAAFEQQGMTGWIASEPQLVPAPPETASSPAASPAPPAPAPPAAATRAASAGIEDDAAGIAERLALLAPVTPDPATTTAIASRTLGLVAAIHIALERNHGLLAGAQRVVAGEAQVREARSELLPQMNLSVRGTQIDEDRAEASFGRDPEYQSVGSLSLDQILYSDEASSRYRVEQLLQAARQHEQEALVLDTVLATATAYLNLLRSEALLGIERENLTLSESNYARARNRLELGVANRAELYRWQTTKANAQARVVNADAAVKRARIELNRTMNQPLGNQYHAVTPSLDEPYFLVSAPAIRDALATPESRPRLREFFVEETLRGAPELKRLRSEMQAHDRRITAAGRKFYLPTLSASAGLDQEFSRRGAGQEKLQFQSPDGQFGGDTDDTEWQVGLEANLPIYQGGARLADQDRLRAEADELQLRYDDTLTGLRAQVMQQAFAAEASFDAIGFARTAAEAGGQNLELVIEAYERGAVPVIDVTDAQTSALISEQNAANALYDFLIDYLKLQRFTGQLDLISSDDDREAVRQRLEEALRS